MDAHLIQKTPEWRKFRENRIGATDASVICGVNPFKTLTQLYNEKKGTWQQKETQAMKHGADLEEEARNSFIKDTGILVFPRVVISANKDTPWAFASLDGMSLDEKTIVEIKCPVSLSKAREILREIPSHYYTQMQHQMWVTNLPTCYFYVYYNGAGSYKIVHRDEEFITQMVKKEINFFKNHMQKDEPPKENSVDRSNDRLWKEKAELLMQIRQEIKNLEKQEKDLRDHLIVLAGYENSHCGNIKMIKVESEGRIDYEKIEELKNLDLDKYRGEKIISWRFTF